MGGPPRSALLVGVDPGDEEALELGAARVEHAQGGVARAREVARDLEDTGEEGVEVELADE